MSPITIRAYQHDDKDQLTTLLVETFPDDPPWNEPQAMIDQKLDHSPENLLLGVDGDGHIIAAVMAGYDGHRGWINTLCVALSHRGHGLGEMMINVAINHLNAQGAVKVNLQIRGDNTSLQRYYESLGFESEDRISMGILTETGKSFL